MQKRQKATISKAGFSRVKSFHTHTKRCGHAVGEDEGVYYFAMEDIDGQTMKQVLAEQKIIPYDQALLIVQQIAEALNYAWKEQKLIHRDIKPDNIMLTRSGRAKLSDLGLASIADEISDDEDSDEILGTPQYISPEQLTGAPLDQRTDIYCLGGTFYHFVTGRFPYLGDSATEIAQQHLSGTLIPPHKINPAVPKSVSRIIMKMMEKSPAKRYQSAAELIEDIRDIRHAADGVTSSIHLPPPGQQPPPITLTDPPQEEEEEEKTSKTSTHGAVKFNVGNKGGKKIRMHTTGEHTASMHSSQTNIATQSRTKIAKKPRSNSNKIQTFVLIGLGALLLLVIVTIGVVFFSMKNRQQSTQDEKIAQETSAPSQLLIAIEPVLAEAKYHRGNKKEILGNYANIEKFILENNPQPVTDEEKKVFANLMSYFNEPDELTLDAARAEAAEKHKNAVKKREEEVLEKERAIQAEKDRKEAEARARAAEQARKKAEQERLKKEHDQAISNVVRMKLDCAKAIEPAIGEGKSVKEAQADVLKVFDPCLNNDYLSSADAAVVAKAKENKEWAEKLKAMLSADVSSIDPAFESDDQLIGLKVEINGKVKTIKKPKKKIVFGNAPFDRSKLSDEEKNAIFAALVEKLGKTDVLWLYYWLKGMKDKAKEANPEKMEELQKEINPQ